LGNLPFPCLAETEPSAGGRQTGLALQIMPEPEREASAAGKYRLPGQGG